MQNFGFKKRLFFLGFSLWKRRFMKPFFQTKHSKMIFLNSLNELEKFSFRSDDEFFIWGQKFSKEELEEKIIKQKEQKQKTHKFFSKKRAILKNKKIQLEKEKQIILSDSDKQKFKPKISFVEDGFVRSITLGSDLTRPFSLIIDEKSLYVDPFKESTLQNILKNEIFDEKILQRARKLIALFQTHQFSKYNGLKHEKLNFNTKEKIILIPAQVEDDASMLLGGFGLSTENFIKELREKNPKAFLVFKPHPDVLSGNRKGLKDEKLILKYCNSIIKDVSIASAIEASDEIHTITSTAGFDALLRGKKVFTYGLPFYANWGLTYDKHFNPQRGRKLSLEELVAGTMILYPKYINPKTKHLCEIEVTLDIMLKMQQNYFSKWWVKKTTDLRIYTFRKTRRIFEKAQKFLQFYKD